ncbi:c-type cytochrome [Paracoccus aurantiacus]|uniref:C-type cytochrome n=1 Tax=Paracoccus aurantiacus TaxID=2599412 RepID=A0A5C6S7S6_9RHOB|nr:cytochrome c [Paracoccus aurantiacus]TXB70440.1 c-type cytochrome [Paracoccus aurantiacus]
MIRFLRILCLLVILGLVAAGLLMWKGWGAGDIPAATVDLASLDDSQRADLVTRGEAVARAGDCAACHADPGGGSDLAGGLPMVTPMGTIYGTNISPSADHGIGGWSADDLYRAVAWGVAPGGRNLYPAMPYVSYHAITREDSDALYAWLMAQPPVEKPNRANSMIPPFNFRFGISMWNALFRPDAEPFQPAAEEAPQDARGRYLVDVLGHCGECHTPRNAAYAMTDDHLAGNVIEGALAPDLRGAALAERGWTESDLDQFFHRGVAPQGVMTFRMFPVLAHSTSHLSDDDIAAMSGYLLAGQDAPGPKPRDLAGNPDESGHQLYLGLCAGCHGTDGRGQPHSSVPLDTNTTAMFADPINLIRIIGHGIEERNLAQGERMQTMPAFDDQLSDAEMGHLATYLRQRWGGQPEAVSAAAVSDARDTIRQAEAAH